MDDINVIGILAAGDRCIADHVRKLLRTDDRFAEIHEEYLESARAFDHWQDRDGTGSRKAVLYCAMMREREQELREILTAFIEQKGK